MPAVPRVIPRGSRIEEGMGLMFTRRFALLSLLVLCVIASTVGVTAGSAFAAPPIIGGVSFSGVGTTEVTLLATIYPEGSDTTYEFEYGSTTAYGSITSSVNVGSGVNAVPTEVTVGGLQPDTVYHARVVVSNESGTVRGEDMTFTTFAADGLGLPDNRSYEKVSPANNADGNVYTPAPVELAWEGSYNEQLFVAAADGDAFAYMGAPSEQGGNGRQGENAGDQYLATRAPSGGWTTRNIDPSPDGFSDVPSYQAFSKNLSVGFFVDRKLKGLAPGAPEGGYALLYENNFSTGQLTPLITVKPPNRTPEEFGAYEVVNYSPTYLPEPSYAGSSADLKHVLYIANDALTPNAVDGGEQDNNLYDDDEGSLNLVNVLPNGGPEPNAMFGGPVLPGLSPEGNSPALEHVISENGTRIFWTAMSTHDLYMREDDERTVQIDASVGGGGQFWDATPDGSKVLFTKAGDLYAYDVEDGQTTDLTPGGEVLGVVGASEDLSYIYFVANGVLAPGVECPAASTECATNLYALHVGEPVRFISKLSKRDNFSKPESFEPQNDGVWQAGLGNKEAEVTPDGRHLVFGTTIPLSGYRNDNAEEIYIYDFEGDHLTCASCNPTGEPPSESYRSAYLPVSHANTYMPRWMSENGDRVFFDTLQALVPRDTNDANDVYEWERDGSGSCTKSEGCIYLLSGGTGVEGSFLTDASADGDDVFIITREQLLSEDQNENIDAYDVRADAPPVPVAPQCTGTGCQGIPSAPPVFSTPSSVTYNGVGNFAAPVKVVTKVKKPVKKKAKKKKAKGKSKKRSSKHTGRDKKTSKAASKRKSVNSNGRSK